MILQLITNPFLNTRKNARNQLSDNGEGLNVFRRIYSISRGNITMRTTITLLILCIASLAFGQPTFTDNTFLDADWTTEVFTFNSLEHTTAKGHSTGTGKGEIILRDQVGWKMSLSSPRQINYSTPPGTHF